MMMGYGGQMMGGGFGGMMGGLGGRPGRQGDWQCRGCSNTNYAFRAECNKCKLPKPAGGGASLLGVDPLEQEAMAAYGPGFADHFQGAAPGFQNPYYQNVAFMGGHPGLAQQQQMGGMGGGQQQQQGGWICSSCQNNNYPFRTKCNRCQAEKA
jgi:hypothetical protein